MEKQYVKIVAEKMEKLVKTFRNGNSVIYKTPLRAQCGTQFSADFCKQQTRQKRYEADFI